MIPQSHEPTAAGGSHPHLVISRNTFALDRPTTVLGSGHRANIYLPDDFTSRAHARITLSDTRRATLEDLGSSNGTFCNNARIDRPTPLLEGDVIRLGDEILRFATTSYPLGTVGGRMLDAGPRDRLTKLFTWDYVRAAIATEFDCSIRTRSPLTVLVVSLDPRGEPSDGPQTARDLATVGELIRGALEWQDLAGRAEHDDFALLLGPSVSDDPTALTDYAGALSSYVSARSTRHIAVNIGGSTLSRTQAASPGELVATAYLALQDAQRAGSGQFSLFQPPKRLGPYR